MVYSNKILNIFLSSLKMNAGILASKTVIVFVTVVQQALPVGINGFFPGRSNAFLWSHCPL